MTNSVDPDETAHDEPSHQDLHCLHKYLVSSVWIERVKTLYGQPCLICCVLIERVTTGKHADFVI